MLLTHFVYGKTNVTSTISKAEFLQPSKSHQMHTWWHWMQGEITKDGITKDLESMKAQGIVQATILNVGLLPEKTYQVPKVKFQSDEWYEMFRWALKEANRLGISIGAHNCDGWSSSGGPWITPEQSMKTFTWSKTQVEGGQNINIQLKQPFTRKDFYQDVAIIALPAKNEPSAFHQNNPLFILNNNLPLKGLADGSLSGGPILTSKDFITISLDKVITVSRLALASQKPFTWADPSKMKVGYNLFYSMDGENYKLACNAKFEGINQLMEVEFSEVKGRYFKLEFSDFPFSDAWFPYLLAEVELLSKGESAFYSATLPFALDKNSTVRSSSKDIYESNKGVNLSGVSEKNIIDLTKLMSEDGTLNWTAPTGKWNIIRFGYTTTGAINSPATLEGEGLECDKMDSKAVAFHFSSFAQKLIDHAGEYNGNTFKFLLLDSWECGLQNWTKVFPNEFKNRRGYDIIPFIPVLCGEIIQDEATSEAFLFDFRKTIAELIEKNYYQQFSELCHQNKLEMHDEVIYGSGMYPPLDVLKANKYADLPMFEFWTGHNGTTTTLEYNASKHTSLDFPASAALFYNNNILGCEAYTGMAHYSETPAELKPYGDRAFCSGINQLILHSYVHQPTDIVPGMTLGQFGSHFNRNNAWFPFTSSWMEYQSRIQYMLQQGQMHADVLYYVGDQLPQYLEAGIPTNVPNGYQIHVANYDILKNKLSVKKGKLIFGNVAFSLLTLPENMGMEIETLERLEELVKGGLIVYGPKPTNQLSLKAKQSNPSKYNALVDKLWGKIDGKSKTENKYGKGKIYWGVTMQAVLDKIKLRPDFQTLSTDTATFLYTHRALGDKDIYFVFNQENKLNKRDLFFRSTKSSVSEYNPKDGSITQIPLVKTKDGRTKVPFSFGPRESRIFVFENSKDQIVPSKFVEKETFIISNFTGSISFDTRGYGKIDDVNISKLNSLTEFDNNDIKYFSGFSNYKIDFKIPDDFLKSKEKVMLNLGKIGNTAKVTLNGTLLGTVWYENTEFDVSGLLKEQNVLEVTVGNAYRNRIIGDFIEFGKLQNVWTSSLIEDYLDKDKPLFPSGLIGPLKLIK